MSDDVLLKNSAPTLAGIKTGSLFTTSYESLERLKHSLKQLNSRLEGKGLRLTMLRCRRGRALIYVYRPGALRVDLSRPGARRILRRCGYLSSNPEGLLQELIFRLREREAFPHEIGLFLGYPIEDVEGYLSDGGRNSLFTGAWQVYGDVEEKKRLFEKYRACTEVYCRLKQSGHSLEQLAVTINPKYC